MTPTTNHSRAALVETRQRLEAQALEARFPRFTTGSIRCRAGQLLNEAGNDVDKLANHRREAASLLAEAAYHLDLIERLARKPECNA